MSCYYVTGQGFYAMHQRLFLDLAWRQHSGAHILTNRFHVLRNILLNDMLTGSVSLIRFAVYKLAY